MIKADHKKQWDFLNNKHESGQLAHAYLFAGQRDIGKKTFALEFVKSLNCAADKGEPCLKCASCKMIEAGNFADLLFIKSLNSASSIKDKKDALEIDVSQIRQAQRFISYKPYYGSYKAVIVEDADRMNIEAQSCFLKTLEEPKGNSIIILISSKPDMLMATILSRCQNVKFVKPKGAQVHPDKMESDRQILKDIVPVINGSLAERFKYVKSIDFDKQNLADILEVSQKYLRYLLFAASEIEITKDQDVLFKGFGSGNKYSVEKIIHIMSLTEQMYNKLAFTNVNPKLALEILLMEF